MLQKSSSSVECVEWLLSSPHPPTSTTMACQPSCKTLLVAPFVATLKFFMNFVNWKLRYVSCVKRESLSFCTLLTRDLSRLFWLQPCRGEFYRVCKLLEKRLCNGTLGNLRRRIFISSSRYQQNLGNFYLKFSMWAQEEAEKGKSKHLKLMSIVRALSSRYVEVEVPAEQMRQFEWSLQHVSLWSNHRSLIYANTTLMIMFHNFYHIF